MQARITQMTIVVTDQQAAVDFYTQKVGFDKKTDIHPAGHPRWVTVGPKGQEPEISLYQHGTRTGERTPEGALHLGNGMFVLTVEDCAKTCEELRSRGVELKPPQPQQEAWGTYSGFADPDGNQFTILQPKKW